MRRIRVKPKKKGPGKKLFQKGHKLSVGRGRPKGSKNKLPAVIRELLMLGTEDAGEIVRDKKGRLVPTEIGGLRAWFKSMAYLRPEITGALLGKILPFQLSGKLDATVRHEHDVLHRIKTEDLNKLSVNELIGLYREAVTMPDKLLALPKPELVVDNDEESVA